MTFSRRQFLLNSARAATSTALIATGLVSYSRYSYSLPATAIRPPGALAEDEFNTACIRCGLCVNDCPYPTLNLATLKDNVALGTPFFTARKAACEMCEDIPCVVACPTGALSKQLTNINDAQMGWLELWILKVVLLIKAYVVRCVLMFVQPKAKPLPLR